MGLLGKCSGRLNSNRAAFRNLFFFDIEAELGGASHHSLLHRHTFWSCSLLSNGCGDSLVFQDEPDSEQHCACGLLGPLTSKKKLRGFPHDVSSFSGGVQTRVAS